MDVWFWVLIGIFSFIILILVLISALIKIASEESRKEEDSSKFIEEHVFLIESKECAGAKFDLTTMFGSDIANKIETMEQNEEGSGLTWLQKHDFFTAYKKGDYKIQREVTQRWIL